MTHNTHIGFKPNSFLATFLIPLVGGFVGAAVVLFLYVFF